MASSKRTATSDLNHNNWDEEDEPEEAGSFIKASEDVLKNRVIKVARRRNAIGSLATSTPLNEPEKKGVFANFGGFGKAPTTTNSSFSFVSNANEQPKTNGISLTNSTNSKDTGNQPNEYYAKIKGLNESVSSWIKKHVDTNPFLNLKPVFRDYEKYFEEIENANNGDISKVLEPVAAEVKAKSAFKLEETSKPSSLFGNIKKSEAPTFTFGNTSTPLTTTNSSGFTFGSTTGNNKLFVSAPVEKPVVDEEESEEPPKVEFTPVVEDGHVYTTRCKVFVKKDDAYGDKGVGTLFLKPIPENDKVQLIVRADTSLGLLLCNFILSSNIPIQRLGKKDVMLVCIPLPDSKPPPVPILLRVKSSEDADELLKILEKHKK